MSMFHDRRPGSPRPQRGGERLREAYCAGCGYQGLASSPATCPKCDSSLDFGDEVLTKTADRENDLFK